VISSSPVIHNFHGLLDFHVAPNSKILYTTEQFLKRTNINGKTNVWRSAELWGDNNFRGRLELDVSALLNDTIQ
jgi:hypothetical protein